MILIYKSRLHNTYQIGAENYLVAYYVRNHRKSRAFADDLVGVEETILGDSRNDGFKFRVMNKLEKEIKK